MNNSIKIADLLIFSLILFATTSCKESGNKNNNDKAGEPATTLDSKPEPKGVETFTVTKAQFENVGMKMGTPAMENFDQTIMAAGFLNVPPSNRAEVRSYVGGYLSSCNLVPGDYVKKGQFLISLNNFDYIQLQQEYLQSKQQLEYLKADYDRKRTLADEKISSQNSMQLAESDYKSMLARNEALRKKLQLINIDPDHLEAQNISSNINLYAPISGYLVNVNAVKGMYAEPTDVIFEIINTDHLHVELSIFEKDATRVKKGQKVLFRLPEQDTFSAEGKVFLVGKSINESDRTVNAHCHLDDESKVPSIIGTYLEAQVTVDTSLKYCLPAKAFLHEDGQNYVLVNTSDDNDEYVFEKVKVNVGDSNEDCKEIIGKGRKLLDGKKVLIDGVDYL